MWPFLEYGVAVRELEELAQQHHTLMTQPPSSCDLFEDLGIRLIEAHQRLCWRFSRKGVGFDNFDNVHSVFAFLFFKLISRDTHPENRGHFVRAPDTVWFTNRAPRSRLTIGRSPQPCPRILSGVCLQLQHSSLIGPAAAPCLQC